jgi:hypothetical protein
MWCNGSTRDSCSLGYSSILSFAISQCLDDNKSQCLLIRAIYILNILSNAMSFLIANALKKERDLYFKGRLIRRLKQSGKVIDRTRDAARPANAAGKRISKSGKVYWETRVNRTDKQDSSV